MKRISLLFVFVLAVVIGYAQKKEKPNIIIIFMDDMGYGDIEPYGMTGIPTPNFNRLAKEGMRFTHFNAGQAVCTASRAALLTGCYPNRIGMTGALLPGAKKALNPQEETIASTLKKVGYKTAMYGKWHLGNKPPYFPVHYGFDSFYGIPYSHDIWPMDYDGNRITDPANFRGTWPVLPVYQNDTKVDSILSLQRQARLTSDFTTRAVDFIKNNKKNPFFLYLAHPMPHVPLAASEKFKGKSELGLFGDVIMEIDWSIGEIMKALDKEKLADNTLLIVTSDNGPWLNFGDHAGSSGGFRQGKSTSWEGGTRVPLFIRWPGKIEASTVNSQLMTNMDILPTLAALTGAPLPSNKIDGMNFLPVWLGQTGKGPREVFYYYFGNNNLEGVRYKNWKLVLNHPSGSYHELHGKYGKPGTIARVDVPMALYDLAHDPGEAYDVQKLYPEIVEKLQALAESAREDLGDDLVKKEGRNVRKPAAVE
ncbi:sulfatase family protein [Chryseosolibacter indicus]|uniref:Sulfatase n=1 Tax=Chryseosolibacter indicus TaxID=2782351 RepID=A0ABS5VKC4_9BACT|nr:sulfatase [Chryseosolibacter indicus]MBT1701898.1 sulfatase [Chryseosolibacter indicus]